MALRVPDAPVHLRSYNPTYEGHPGQIKKAARAIARAKRPVLYVGGGVISSDASPELMELAELTQIPLTQTLMGLGAFPMAHPLSLDMLGMHGAYYANMAVHNSDLLVAIGARFDDRVTGRVDAFAPNAEIIHIDIDPSSISKNIKVDIPIVGDCKRVLGKLVEAVREEMKDGIPARRRRGPPAVGGPDRLVEARLPAPLRVERRGDQAAVRDPGDLEPDPGRGIRRHRRGAAPDVGGPVLPVQAPAALVHLGRAGDHGLRPADARWASRPPIRTSSSSTSTATARSR